MDMAKKGEISWNSLESLLEDFSPDLVSSKQIIKILLKEMKILLEQSKGNIHNDQERAHIIDAKEAPIELSDSRNKLVESVTEIETMNLKPEITLDIDDDVDLQIEDPQINSDAFELEETVLVENAGSNENEAIKNEVKPKILVAFQEEINVENEVNDEAIPNENESHEESVDVGDLKNELFTYLSGSVDNNSDNKWYTFVGENQIDQETFNVKVENTESIRKEPKSISELFQCKTCAKNFTVKKNLMRHMKIHSGQKPYQCKTCSKCFNNSKTLKNHKITHTQEKPFDCKTCFKKFKLKNHLSRHELVHSGEKPFKCNICSKCYKQSNDLQIHIRSHTNEKPFQCKSCQKEFKDSSSFKEHMTLHTVEKETHKCKICSKSFQYAKTLKRHQRIHSGERPFQCNTCSKSFTQSQHLTRHQNIHILR